MAKTRKHPTHRERMRARTDQPVQKPLEPPQPPRLMRHQRDLRRRAASISDLDFDPEMPDWPVRFK